MSASPTSAGPDLPLDSLPRDGPAAAPLLALNNAFAAELSFHSPESWARLVEGAFFARRVGEADAFVIAFSQDAAYDSPNFLWFKRRLSRFVYVDRVVTAPAARGRGLARRLYAALFAAARAGGHDTVCCEVNSEPPNPASDTFHAALGFAPVGQGVIHGGAKRVRYLARALGPPPERGGPGGGGTS